MIDKRQVLLQGLVHMANAIAAGHAFDGEGDGGQGLGGGFLGHGELLELKRWIIEAAQGRFQPIVNLPLDRKVKREESPFGNRNPMECGYLGCYWA
ncbi:hypothetical protein D3C86_1836140 [compost metagenome]